MAWRTECCADNTLGSTPAGDSPRPEWELGPASPQRRGTTNPHRYVGALGYYAEPDLGLNYVRARWLRPSTGSRLSVDPVAGEPRYGYAHGVPTAVVDAGGRFGEVGPSVLHPE